MIKNLIQEGDNILPPPNTPIIKRVELALNKYGYHNQWNDINNCKHESYCKSIYCNRCRTFQKKRASDRMIKLFYEKYNSNETTAYEDLRHLTVLCDVVELDQANVGNEIERSRAILKALKRRFPGLILEGRYEIEIINIDDLYRDGSCPRKIRSIEFLTAGMSRLMSGDRVLVHFHVLVALNSHNHQDVLKWIESRYPGDHCVYMTRLHRSRSIEDNLNNIGSYPIKNSHRYNLGFEYKEYKLGSYISSRSLSFLVLCNRSLNERMIIISYWKLL